MDRPVAVHHPGCHGLSRRPAGAVVWATLASGTPLSFSENTDEIDRAACMHAADGAQGILRRTARLQPGSSRHVGGGSTVGRRRQSSFFQPSTARVAGALRGLGPRRHRPRQLEPAIIGGGGPTHPAQAIQRTTQRSPPGATQKTKISTPHRKSSGSPDARSSHRIFVTLGGAAAGATVAAGGGGAAVVLAVSRSDTGFGGSV